MLKTIAEAGDAQETIRATERGLVQGVPWTKRSPPTTTDPAHVVPELGGRHPGASAKGAAARAPILTGLRFTYASVPASFKPVLKRLSAGPAGEGTGEVGVFGIAERKTHVGD